MTNPNHPINAIKSGDNRLYTLEDMVHIEGMGAIIGLTKREDFAKSAMIGLLSAVDLKDFDSEELSQASVRIADELIKALNK